MGTDVSKEAAAMILVDDDFSAIMYAALVNAVGASWESYTLRLIPVAGVPTPSPRRRAEQRPGAPLLPALGETASVAEGKPRATCMVKGKRQESYLSLKMGSFVFW
jgi:hypothetical protein